MANQLKSRPQSIHGWVAEELGTRIVSGIYSPGEYIPNETTIGEELGVSRTALREVDRRFPNSDVRSRWRMNLHPLLAQVWFQAT